MISSKRDGTGGHTLTATPIFLFTKKLFEEFHHNLFENCARLAEAKPYLDEEELEDMAFELTQKQFYYQAKNFLEITRKDKNWWRGLE